MFCELVIFLMIIVLFLVGSRFKDLAEWIQISLRFCSMLGLLLSIYISEAVYTYIFSLTSFHSLIHKKLSKIIRVILDDSVLVLQIFQFIIQRSTPMIG